jgi:6-phospho-beta-glucosidase
MTAEALDAARAAGRLKVAIVGGGGFRVPMLVEALDVEALEIGLEEIVLYDVDPDRLERMRMVVSGMRETSRGQADLARVRATGRLADAVDGAGAVLVAIRVGGTIGRIADEEVPLELGVLGQETVGPGGIAFAIRTIPVLRSIAEEVAAVAPSAWFLNFTNPAGMVTQSLRPILGDRAVGICDSPSTVCRRAANASGRSIDQVDIDYAGLNHLGWIVGMRDPDGHDILTELLADDERLMRIEEVRLVGADRVRRVGAIPNEYLVYLERTADIVATFRGNAGRGAIVHAQQTSFDDTRFGHTEEAFSAWRRTRDARHGTYLAEARSADELALTDERDDGGVAPGNEHAAFSYSDVAAQFLRSTVGSTPRRQVLDVANRGRLPFLDDDDVIEATCDVSMRGVTVVPGTRLPDEAATLVERVKEVERLTIRAATERRADLALEAIASHPVVPSREVAEQILAGYLDRHETLRKLLR